VLAAGQAVDARVGAVAQHEAIAHEGLLDALDSGEHARVVGRAVADLREEEQRRVDLRGAVVLSEVAVHDALLVDLGTGALAQGPPGVDVAVETVLLDGAHGPVEGRPDHDARVGEAAQVAADLPDAVVGAVELLGGVAHEVGLEPPRELGLDEAGVARRGEGDEHLPDDVGLVLECGAVADPHRLGVGVAGEVGQLVLGEVALAGEPVHDLQVGGVARDRPQQPGPPAVGEVDEAVREERLEGEGGVAQPHEAVVPVAGPAEVLGQ